MSSNISSIKDRGFAGKLCFIDLTGETISIEETPEELAKNYFGGYGLGAKILYDRMPAHADPLGPDNMLGFVPGSINSATGFFGGRYMAVCKSPVYNAWNDSNSGGFFGPELKKAGLDGLFVTGIANRPVYILIVDGKVEIKDADWLWGKYDADETCSILEKHENIRGLKVACIGAGGENMALTAGIVNDGHRIAARGGPGAVMGSKNLKAVAVKGSTRMKVARPKELAELNREIAGIIGKPDMESFMGGLIESYKSCGTPGGHSGLYASGDGPIMNWKGAINVDFKQEQVDVADSNNFQKIYPRKKYSCSTCPVGCGAVFDLDDAKWPLKHTGRPEYEATAGFGALCLVDDIDAIFKCNDMCNRSGLDSISIAGTMAWAMESFVSGELTKEHLDGIELNWGDGDAMVALCKKICDIDGCGKILANGSRYASEYWGVGADYLVVLSGIEPGMHDPRNQPGQIRGYQFDPTPGRHIRGGVAAINVDNPERGKLDAIATGEYEVKVSAGFCTFTFLCFTPETVKRYINAVTGWDYTDEDIVRNGQRILTLRQAFNIREGFYRKDYTASDRILGIPPLKEGPNAGVVLENEKMADMFYEALGWDLKTGVPSRESLERLGDLENVIKDIYAV